MIAALNRKANRLPLPRREAFEHRQRLSTAVRSTGWRVRTGMVKNTRTGSAFLHGLVLRKIA